MSFGYSIGDAVLLAQLAWKTVQNARKACGEYDELTQEVLSLHVVLRRLEHEVEKPENLLNGVRSGEPYKEHLQVIVNGCQRVLRELDQVLKKYNALSEKERRGKRLWQKIKFGNGKMADMAEMRAKLTSYTSAMSLFLDMVSMGAMGRVERQINDTGGDLKEIKVAVNGIAAHLMPGSNRHEGSVLTAYAGDDRAVWKEFRRELVKDGFSSSVIRKHKRLIKAYIEELFSRGVFDEDPNMDVKEHCCDIDHPFERTTAYNPETENVLKASSEVESVIESQVESTRQTDFEKPNTASQSETESPGRERPIGDCIPAIPSQPKHDREMRWVSLTTEDQRERDKKETRIFHSMEHELYDDIVKRFIEWGFLPFHKRPQICLSILIYKISRLSADIRNLALPEDLSESKRVLLEEVDYNREVMKRHRKDPNLNKWSDKRCGGLAYSVGVDTFIHTNIHTRETYVMTGARFCSQLPADGVCEWVTKRDLRDGAHAHLGDATTP